MFNDRAWNKPAKGLRSYRRYKRAAEGHRPELKYERSVEPRITVSLDGDNFDAMVGIAASQQRSTSSVIREAVRFYLEQKGHSKPRFYICPSCHVHDGQHVKGCFSSHLPLTIPDA